VLKLNNCTQHVIHYRDGLATLLRTPAISVNMSTMVNGHAGVDHHWTPFRDMSVFQDLLKRLHHRFFTEGGAGL
jgi:hypothetical protein